MEKSICLLLSVSMAFSLSLFTACVEEQFESSSNVAEHTLRLSVNEANAVKIKKTGSYEIPEKEAIEMMHQMFRNEIGTKSENDFEIKSCKKVSFPWRHQLCRGRAVKGLKQGIIS